MQSLFLPLLTRERWQIITRHIFEQFQELHGVTLPTSLDFHICVFFSTGATKLHRSKYSYESVHINLPIALDFEVAHHFGKLL